MSKNRFADILGTTPAAPPPTLPQAEAEAAPATRGQASGKVPGWEPAHLEDEPLQRLNVEIPRSLHNKLKAEALRLGRSKRELVTALLEWALEDTD